MSLYKRQKELDLNTDQSLTIAGCGGIGYWVAKFAAMSGMENIILFDPDVWEEHNRNRVDIPDQYLGKNKAEVTKLAIEVIRPNCFVKSFPFPLQEFSFTETDWLVDCTDVYKTQKFLQKLTSNFKTRYMKVGYDGLHISIHDRVAEWGEETEGYTIIPSWVGSPVVIAALAVTKIVKYPDKEVSCNMEDLFYTGKR